MYKLFCLAEMIGPNSTEMSLVLEIDIWAQIVQLSGAISLESELSTLMLSRPKGQGLRARKTLH